MVNLSLKMCFREMKSRCKDFVRILQKYAGFFEIHSERLETSLILHGSDSIHINLLRRKLSRNGKRIKSKFDQSRVS